MPIELNSALGRELLDKSTINQFVEWSVYFECQENLTFCGVASGVMVLNLAEVTAPLSSRVCSVGESGSKPQLGFVLCATKRPWQGQVYVREDIEPFPPYLQVCRDGAQLVSSEFHHCLLQTTMLADGLAKLAAWCDKTEQ